MSGIWTAIVLIGVGTFAMRASFLAFAHRLVDVPPNIQRILRQIPAAALAAIVAPAFLRPEGQFDLLQPRLAAGILAGLIAWRTRNIALTLLVGMAALMLLDAL